VPKSHGRPRSKKQTKPASKKRGPVANNVPNGQELSAPPSWFLPVAVDREPAPLGPLGSNPPQSLGAEQGRRDPVTEVFLPPASSPAVPPPPPAHDAALSLVAPAELLRPLQIMPLGCDALQELNPQGLGLTYWFDAAPDGEPYPVTIRFTGQHTGETLDEAVANRTFDIQRTLARVIPGSGRNAFTARALDLAPGEWQVTAAPVPASAAPPNNAGTPGPPSHQPRLPHGSATGTTTYAPVARVRAPGMRIGAWPAFVAGGTLVALTTQALLADHQHLPAIKLLLVSLIACLLGLVGAKVYYAVTHLHEKDNGLFNGMCIQGFVLAAIGTLLAGALVSDIPVGRMLDVTTPGLLLGLSIGRLGCFFGGCCAGKPTASRWGLWSSDREVGVRRIPVQLIESASTASLAIAALAVVLLTSPATGGVIFVGAMATNTFIRQPLFKLRGTPRATTHGRTLTMALTALVLAVDLTVAVRG